MKAIRKFSICFMCMAIFVQAENNESKQSPQKSAGIAKYRPDEVPQDTYRLGALRSNDVKHRGLGETRGSNRFGYPGQNPQYSPDFLHSELKPANELFPPLSNLDLLGLYSQGPVTLSPFNNLNFLPSQPTSKPNLFNGVFTNQKPYSNYLLQSLLPSNIPSSMINSGLVPLDGEQPTPCLNSRTLQSIFNRLFNLLHILMGSNNPQLGTLNLALDTLETQLRSGGLNDEELSPKLKVLERQLRQSPPHQVPGTRTKLAFKDVVPNIQQPDCKAAFLKLMELAYTAYLQAAEYPNCKFNIPYPLMPNGQPFSPDAPFSLEPNEPVPLTPNVPPPFNPKFPYHNAKNGNNPDIPKPNAIDTDLYVKQLPSTESGISDKPNTQSYQGQYPVQINNYVGKNPNISQNWKSAELNTNEDPITRSKLANLLRLPQSKPNGVDPNVQSIASALFVNRKGKVNSYNLVNSQLRQADEEETIKTLEQPKKEKDEARSENLVHLPDQNKLGVNPTVIVKADPLKGSEADLEREPVLSGNKRDNYALFPDSKIRPGSPASNILEQSRYLLLPEKPKERLQNLLRSYPQYRNPNYPTRQFLNQFPVAVSNPNKLNYFNFYDSLPKTIFAEKPHAVDDLTKNIWLQEFYQNLKKPYNFPIVPPMKEIQSNYPENIASKFSYKLTPKPEFIDLTKKADGPKDIINNIKPELKLDSTLNDVPLKQFSEVKPTDAFTLLQNYRPGQKIEISNLNNDDAEPRNANEEEFNINLKHAVQLIENLKNHANDTESIAGLNKFSPSNNSNEKSVLRDAHLNEIPLDTNNLVQSNVQLPQRQGRNHVSLSVTNPGYQPAPLSLLPPSYGQASQSNLLYPSNVLLNYQPGYRPNPKSLPLPSYQRLVHKYEGLFSQSLNERYNQPILSQTLSPLVYLFNNNRPMIRQGSLLPFSDPSDHSSLRNNLALDDYYDAYPSYSPDELQSLYSSSDPSLIYTTHNDNTFNPSFQDMLNYPADINGNDIGGLVAVWFNRDKPKYPPPVINVFLSPDCQDFSMSQKLYLMQLLKYFNVLQPGGEVSEQNHELLKLLVMYLKAILGKLQISQVISQPDINIDDGVPNNGYQIDSQFYYYLEQIIATAIPDQEIAHEVSEALKIYIERLIEQGVDLSKQENINLVLVYLQNLISQVKPLPDIPTINEEVPEPITPPGLDPEFVQYLYTVLYKLVQEPQMRQTLIMKLEIFIQELITHDFDLRDKRTVDLILEYLKQLLLELPQPSNQPTTPPYIDPPFIDPQFIDPQFIDPQFIDLQFIDPPVIDPPVIDPPVIDPLLPINNPSWPIINPPINNPSWPIVNPVFPTINPPLPLINPDIENQINDLIITAVPITIRNQVLVQVKAYISILIQRGVDLSKPEGMNLVLKFINDIISQYQIPLPLPQPTLPPSPEVATISPDFLESLYKLIFASVRSVEMRNNIIVQLQNYIREMIQQGTDWSDLGNLKLLELYVEKLIQNSYGQQPVLPPTLPPPAPDTPLISKEILHYVYNVFQELIGDQVQVELAVTYFHEYVKWAVTVGFDLTNTENLNRLIGHILTLVYKQESPNIPIVTESNKLLPATVEITYTLQTKLTYGKDGLVKYRVPYNTFVSNLRDLLLRKPVLRAHQDKLEDELSVATNITAVSPELRDVPKPELIKLIARSGAFVDAKIPKDAIDTQSRDGNNLAAAEQFDKMVHKLDAMINKEQTLNINKIIITTTPRIAGTSNDKYVLVTHDSASGFDPIAFDPANPLFRSAIRSGPSNEELGVGGFTTHNALGNSNVSNSPNFEKTVDNFTKNEKSVNASVAS